jgi:hypothetical protein
MRAEDLPETPLSNGTGITAANFRRVPRRSLKGLKHLHPGGGYPEESGHD